MGPAAAARSSSHTAQAGLAMRARRERTGELCAVRQPWHGCQQWLDQRGVARFGGGAPTARGGGAGQGGRGGSSPEERRDVEAAEERWRDSVP
jgi:hypothetical protein